MPSAAVPNVSNGMIAPLVRGHSVSPPQQRKREGRATRYAHVDKDGGVDERVDDVVHRLVFVELALAVVPGLPFSDKGKGMRYCRRLPGERNASDEGCKQIITPELNVQLRKLAAKGQTSSELTIPMNPRQKKASPIPYAKKLSSTRHERLPSVPCPFISNKMHSPSSHCFCSANRSVFLAMYLPPSQPLRGLTQMRAAMTHPTTTPKTMLRKTS